MFGSIPSAQQVYIRLLSNNFEQWMSNTDTSDYPRTVFIGLYFFAVLCSSPLVPNNHHMYKGIALT
jgi:hypothetical protein